MYKHSPALLHCTAWVLSKCIYVYVRASDFARLVLTKFLPRERRFSRRVWNSILTVCKLDVVVVATKRLSRAARKVVRADAKRLFISAFSACLCGCCKGCLRYFYRSFVYLIVVNSCWYLFVVSLKLNIYLAVIIIPTVWRTELFFPYNRALPSDLAVSFPSRLFLFSLSLRSCKFSRFSYIYTLHSIMQFSGLSRPIVANRTSAARSSASDSY